MNEFKIGRRSTTCGVSGRAFEPGDVIVSVILEEPDGFVRHDVLEEFADKVEGEPFCVFRTRQPEPPAPPHRLDYDFAQQFLDRLLHEADPAREPLVYALTLLLARKRRVKILETRKLPEGDLLSVAIPRAEEPEIVQVRAPRLSEEQEAALQAELAGLFDLGGEGPAAEPETPGS